MLSNRIFIYTFIGFFPFFFYAFYHYFYGEKIIGYISIFNAVLLFITGATIYLKKDLNETLAQWHSNLMLLLMSASVVVICYFIGLRGAAYIFPLTIGFFFNFKLKNALLFSGLLIALGLYFTSFTVANEMVFRIFIPIVLTVIIAYLYANQIEKHKNAYRTEANHDYLTGLFNRRHFNRWLERTLSTSSPVDCLTLIFIDLDNFKVINDNHGHEFGDKYLVAISHRLKTVIASSISSISYQEYKIARIAGDEFVISFDGEVEQSDIECLTSNVLLAINKPLVIDNVNLIPQASIGVSHVKHKNQTADNIINEADSAMFEAKKQGKNQVVFFDDALAQKVNERNAIVNAIQHSISHNEFSLNFMPIWNKSACKIVGAEVLIRTKNPLLQSVGPDVYIPLAEQHNLISQIDLWVIEESFKYLQYILRDFADNKFVLAINISGLELTNSKFPEQVRFLLNKYHVPSEQIELEITETCFINCTQNNVDVLHALKALGVKLALDDFGTGYTAFNQLMSFPVNTLKIDRSFVNAIDDNSQTQHKHMVDVILSLAELYQLTIVAEGVESQQQLDYLQALGCDYYQGYFLSKPLIWQKFYKVLNDSIC